MSASRDTPRGSTGDRRQHRRTRGPSAPGSANVLDVVAARIERAIEGRTRYKYVRPRVVREGVGWKIVSPNCSRTVDAGGGEIDIAWFTPADGAWQLHARDDRRACWVLKAGGQTLDAGLALVCADTQRMFWR